MFIVHLGSIRMFSDPRVRAYCRGNPCSDGWVIQFGIKYSLGKLSSAEAAMGAQHKGFLTVILKLPALYLAVALGLPRHPAELIGLAKACRNTTALTLP